MEINDEILPDEMGSLI